MADDEVMAEVQVTEPETATRGAAPGGTVPWVEKYRPATIDGLQQQDQVKSHAAPLPDPRRSSAHNAPLAISHPKPFAREATSWARSSMCEEHMRPFVR